MAANRDGYDISDILQNLGNPDAPHDNVQPFIIRYNIAAIAVACVTILVRTCVRAFIVRQVLMEDYLIIAAGAAATALSAMIILGVGYGLGKHIWDLSLLTITDRVQDCIQVLFICQCLHATALTLVKLSVISTYWRLFPNKRMRHTLVVLAFLITSVAVATVFGTLFQCTPVAAAWDFTIENSKCMEIRPLYYFSTSFSAATDIFLCILPLPLFWRLKITLHEKIIVSCLFGVGLFAAAASIRRATVLSSIQNVDVTMRAMPALGWSVAEVITGIVCACLPCLKPLFNKLLPSRLVTYMRNTDATDKDQKAATTTTATTCSTTSETYRYTIEGPGIQRKPSQVLAHLSISGSGLWRGRGQSWYTRPTLQTVGSWRDRPDGSKLAKELETV